MPQQEFLFVNPGNKTRGGHKISTSGRAFVIRKARAAQPWSTKSSIPKTPAPLDAAVDAGAGRTVSRRAARVGANGAVLEAGRKSTQVAPGRRRKKEAPLVRECQCGRLGCRCELRVTATTALGTTLISETRHLSGRFDPLGCLPVPMLTAADVDLFTYFNTAISPLLTGPTGSDEVDRFWLTVSFSHAGFLSALLAVSALQMAVEHPQYSSRLLERFMHHRLQTISAIQKDLAVPEKATSNENLATVFNLLIMEENLYIHASDTLAADPMWLYLQPTPDQRQAHMAGLKRMLELRGGVGRIGNMRGLQSFIVRWICTALGCRIVFTLPRAYRPDEPEDPEEEELCERSFAASHLLPHGMLTQLYNYPESSAFFSTPFPMPEACRAAGFHPELVRHILTFECLHSDTMAWMMRRDTYTWDALDMQNLFSIAMGELVRWYLVNEETISPADNVVAMCLFIFAFIVGLGAHTACSPVPGVLPRMRKQFLDPDLRSQLRAAGIDGWVAFLLLIASTQNPDDGDYFFRYYVETLAARSPPVRTFEDFRKTVFGCIWSPAMDPHLRKAWDHIHDEWERLRVAMETDSSVANRAMRPRDNEMYHHMSIPMSSPYSTAHMKSIFVARDKARLGGRF